MYWLANGIISLMAAGIILVAIKPQPNPEADPIL
jgi:hypothetical protein